MNSLNMNFTVNMGKDRANYYSEKILRNNLAAEIIDTYILKSAIVYIKQ